MSSKFSLNSAVQQPPPVCRKPPDTPLLPIPPLEDRILIVYTKAYWPIITPPFDVTTHFPLYPTPLPYVWGGITKFPVDNIQVVVTYDHTTHLLDVELQLKKFEGTLNTVTFHDLPVIDPNKFGTRMAESVHRPTASRYQVQVYQ